MSRDLRVHRRLEVRLSAEVATEGERFTAITRNLSSGGCCLESAHPFTEDVDLGLSLFLVVDGVEDHRQPPMSLRGHVQWTAEADAAPAGGLQQHVAGIRFTSVTPAQAAWLEKVLARVPQTAA